MGNEAEAGGRASAPVVQGYDVTGWLGAGATGAVWRGRDRVSGEAVAIKRLYGAVSLAGRDRLRRQAAVLQVLDHPHVVRLHRLVMGEDDVVLVTGLAGGGSLAALLARRGRLGAGEVVTIGTPLAQALAAVHARGLVHGAVDARAVLFSDDGRPMWSDLGLAYAIGASAEPAPTAAGDVLDLGVLLADAVLGGSGPGDERDGPGGLESLGALDEVLPRQLASAIGAACDPDPAARPSAADFAVMLYDAVAALPVGLAGPAWPAHEAGPREVPDVVVLGSPSSLRLPPVQPRRVGHRRRRRTRVASRRRPRARAGLAAVALATLVLLAVGGLSWWRQPVDAAPADFAPGATTATTSVDAADGLPATSGHDIDAADGLPVTSGRDIDAADVLARLDAQRSLAYEIGDAALLGSLYLDSSPAGQADVRNLERMLAAGERAHGFRTETTSAQVLTSGADVVQLTVTDTVPAFEVVRVDGGPVRTEPGRGERTFRITLNHVDGHWLYAALEAVDQPANA